MAKLLTNRDLAEYLQVSSMTLSRWRKEGLPFINIGTQIRFELEPVMKWLKENKGK
ncbi:MAG TPA: helix-turn-helix domain-containing protein [Clostridiaceae bacterium]